MYKKVIILGSVLLLVGGSMLGWVLVEKRKQQERAARYESKYNLGTGEYLKQYNKWLQSFPDEQAKLPFELDGDGKTKTEEQLKQEQQERLQADLGKLAAGETDVYPFADILYGENWQNELNRYKKHKELSEFVLTGSIVCTSMGGTIFAWYLLLWLVRFSIRGSSGLKRLLPDILSRQRKTKDKKQAKTSAEKNGENREQEQELNQQKRGLETHPNGLRNFVKRKPKLNSREKALFTKSESRTDNRDSKRSKKLLGAYSNDNAEKFGVLLSDEKYDDSIARLEDSLKAQTEKLEELTAQSVQQAIIEHSKPLDSTLKDLAQQVSAIREYASCQQERVEKLQDGYDWNIVRTFCLRIIRCIDNLENRISQLSSEGTTTEQLEDIKDELIFALDSSGIEQFEPEVNSNYRGQEKYAEAVKDKEPCNNSKQKGKIAKVIRPGYQYFINEENIKVVRTAQVKLFG
ncbi:MAG: nucleotide exchange factor GrpE [Sedimentisphaerales bacterium]|jgi:molecular chaperone GrpE (heat shock protein)